MPKVMSNNAHQEPVEEKTIVKALEFSLATFHLTLQTDTQGENKLPKCYNMEKIINK